MHDATRRAPDARSLRLAADAERLQALSRASSGRVRILESPVGVRSRWTIALGYRTSGTMDYPARSQPAIELAIDVAGRYPFQPPVATVLSPIVHPNVFESGIVCLGTRWVPSEGLDLFVHRVARLLTYDPMLVNLASVANAAAAAWYRTALRRHPQAFPSDVPAWQSTGGAQDPAPGTASSAGSEPSPRPAPHAAPHAAKRESPPQPTVDRVELPCPACSARLRLPAGRSGTVACPRCGHEFAAQT